MNKDPNVEKQIEELARSFCGLSAKLKCSECSYECYQKEYARKAFEAGYRKTSEVAREIFAEIETSLLMPVFKGSEVYCAIREEDYLHYKKKYTEDGG